MSEPIRDPLTFQELKQLAWARIPRSEDTAPLYSSEERAREAISEAANELHKVFTSPEGKPQISRDEALVMELVTVLDLFRPEGATAARIIVDRYGMKNE
jgi:hypothetical protein